MPQHLSNFAFLPPAFKDLAEASRKAEGHIMGDPRAACFHEPGGAAQGANGRFSLAVRKNSLFF